jgi:hypothetical protein
MTMHRFQQWLLFLAIATSMGACGGGGDGGSPSSSGPGGGSTTPPPTTASPQWSVTGVFGAKMTLGAAERDVILVALGDLAASPPTAVSIIGVYGTDASTDFKAMHVFAVSTTDLIGVPLSNFNGTMADWALSGSMDSGGPSVSGTLQLGGEAWSLNGGAVPGTGYQADVPASLEDIQGQWTVSNERGDQITLDIGADGEMSASIGTCQFGRYRITPALSQMNVFTMSITAGMTCSHLTMEDGWSYGFVLAYPSAAGGTQLLFASIDDMSGDTWIAAAGKR